MKESEYTDVDNFLQEVNLCNPRWYEDGDTQCYWIFRSQREQRLNLQPNITRLNKDSQKYTYNKIFESIHSLLLPGVPDLSAAISNRVRSTVSKSENIYQERLIDIIRKIFVELSLIEEFLLKANQLGLYVPSLKLFHRQYSEISAVQYFYDYLDLYMENFLWVDKEKTALYEKHSPSQYNQLGYKIFIEFDFPEANALAQHHGIPTRFLDWTSSPYVASFFAAEECSKNDEICVWALNTRYLKSCMLRGQVNLHKNMPHAGLEFLHCQQGLFTEMLGAEGYYFHHGEWPTLEQYIKSSDSETLYLEKIKLKVKDPCRILNKLSNMNVNRIHLMPTYDNIARDINKSFST